MDGSVRPFWTQPHRIHPSQLRTLTLTKRWYFLKGTKNAGQPLFMRKFIPSKLSDNPYLAKDGTNAANLLSLPEMQRRQLLEGDWNVADGAAFSEFRTSIHVIEPFDIPHEW